MEKIYIKEGISPEFQSLMHGGKILIAGLKISDYGIVWQDAIIICARTKGGMQIFFKSSTGNKIPLNRELALLNY